MLELLDKKIDVSENAERGEKRKGLTSSEAALRLERDGENILGNKKKKSRLKMFAGQFHDVMVMILLAAALISVILGEYADAVPIILIVVINATLGYFQEYRCEKTLEKLEEMTSPTARVYRDGILTKIPASQVVEGDVFEVRAGDKIPCDGFIISSNALTCDESALTGESVTVNKFPRTTETDFSAINKGYMGYMGTVVTKGSAVMEAVCTGQRSQMGRVSKMLEDIEPEQTPLQKKLGELGKTLAVICLAVCVIVAVAGILRGEPVLDMLMTGITIAIAAIPEGLPAAVTIALALAVRKMLKRNALVHKLTSVETLGCVSVICSDKTGTITQNKMVVKTVCCGEETFSFSENIAEEGIFNQQEEKVNAEENIALKNILVCGAMCNNAKLITPQPERTRRRKHNREKFSAEGDPTECGILSACARAGIFPESTGFDRAEEIPFDNEKRSMTVICSDEKGEKTGFTKGAPDVIIRECDYYLDKNGEIQKLNVQKKLEFLRLGDVFAAKGLRVISFEIQKEEKKIYLGFMGMEDPPREGVLESVLKCRKAGIRTVMITGDHTLTASAVARQAGILKQGEKAVSGEDIDSYDDQQLKEICKSCNVFARVTPQHKHRIVKAFKSLGKITAMTGDGVNDAPAVKEADVGVSMGLQGTEVTKQAADIILLDDNFSTLVNAVEYGRCVYRNIRKFVRYLISCNIGEVLTMFGGILMGLPMVLTPAQILLVNLVTDSLPAVALGLEPPEPSEMKKPPRKENDSFWDGGLLGRILIRGVLIGLCTLATFTIILKSTGVIETARTGALITLVLSQLIHVFECKSEEKNLFTVDFMSNPFLLFSVIISAVVLGISICLPVLRKVFSTSLLGGTPLIISLVFSFAVPVLAGVFGKKK